MEQLLARYPLQRSQDTEGSLIYADMGALLHVESTNRDCRVQMSRAFLSGSRTAISRVLLLQSCLRIGRLWDLSICGKCWSIWP